MKNQKGVSLITLIITIIVVIILAVIVLRSGANEAPDQANFSKFASEMGELQDAVKLAMLTAKGEEQLKGNQRTEAQLYNFVARGGYEGFEAEKAKFSPDAEAAQMTNDVKWLKQYDAEASFAVTQINEDFAEKIIGMKLPNRKVETAHHVGQKVSYFVTSEGTVFCWPPYVYDGKSYVNADTTVKSGDQEIGDTAATEFKDIEIKFKNNEIVSVANKTVTDDRYRAVSSNSYIDPSNPGSVSLFNMINYDTEKGVVYGMDYKFYDNIGVNYLDDGTTL